MPVPQTVLPLAAIEMQALLRLAADLGAADVGGPLSREEAELLRKTSAMPATSANELSRVRAQLAAGLDPLGDRFCQLRSGLERRGLGAFYTPAALVDPMVAWSLERGPARVVDAGCGSGRFARAVAMREPRMPVVAVDIDAHATILARASLAACGATAVRVVHGDFTTLELDDIDGSTAFVGNPPYVRHHDLPAKLKDWGRRECANLGITTSALAGLHAYFYVKIASLARAGDLGCLVTSAEWLDVGYGRMVRELLMGGLGGSAIHVLSPEAIAFDDAMTTAAIACFEVGVSTETLRVRLVGELGELGELGGGHAVARKRLQAANRWSPEIRRAGRGLEDGGEASGPSLRDVLRVHRGVVTGNNGFFVMSRERAAELGIADYCRPVITSAREILGADGVVRAGHDTRVILDAPSDLELADHPELAAYLRAGEAQGVASGYIASRRKPWWRMGFGKPPPIVASYMARQAPVFALNPDRMVLLNIAHGLYPIRKLTGGELAQLVAGLNDHRESYRGAGRTYHGGLEKFEPREMEALPLPASCGL